MNGLVVKSNKSDVVIVPNSKSNLFISNSINFGVMYYTKSDIRIKIFM